MNKTKENIINSSNVLVTLETVHTGVLVNNKVKKNILKINRANFVYVFSSA